MTGVETMGRPRKDEKKAAAAAEERAAIIHLKGSPAYGAFVEAVNRKTHIPKAAMFRLAFADWCEKHGHGTPPEL